MSKFEEVFTQYDNMRFEIYRRLLDPYIEKTTKVLDMGCAHGEILKYLPSDIEYLGLDDKESNISEILKKGGRGLKIDIEHDELNLNDLFDIALCTEVLEHMQFPEKILTDLTKLVKRNGIILISLPNDLTLMNRIGVLIGAGIDYPGLISDDHHKHFATITQSTEIVEKYFDIITTEYRTHIDMFNGHFKPLTQIIPVKILMFLAKHHPSLFARGIIFICRQKSQENL